MNRLIFLLTLLIASLPGCATTAPPPTRRIALTFDDVPRQRGAYFTPDERTTRLIAALRKAGVRQAAVFVTPGHLARPDGEGGEARIAAYAAAGHVLANHSFSHRSLHVTPAADYLADIDRAEAWLKDRKGRRPWFRHPYLDEGREDKAKRDAVRAGLAARGLRNGYVTVDASDWNIDALTTAAVKAGKKVDVAALRDLYVELHVEAAEYNDDLARRTIGRSPAHVMLLHETDIAALFIPDLVAALRAKGWTIVTADAAFADPLKDEQPDVPVARGALTEAMAWQKGLPAPRWYGRVSPRVQDPEFALRVLGEAPATR